MSRSSYDFNFTYASKPCEKHLIDFNAGSGIRTEIHPCEGLQCNWYPMCDIEGRKTPWEQPTLPKEGRIVC